MQYIFFFSSLFHYLCQCVLSFYFVWHCLTALGCSCRIVNSFEDILEYLITSDDFEAFDVIGDNIILLAETVTKKSING